MQPKVLCVSDLHTFLAPPYCHPTIAVSRVEHRTLGVPSKVVDEGTWHSLSTLYHLQQLMKLGVCVCVMLNINSHTHGRAYIQFCIYVQVVTCTRNEE